MDKDKLANVIERLIDDDKLDMFKRTTVKFACAFKEQKENPDISDEALAYRLMDYYNDLEDPLKEYERIREDLNYDEWAMSLIYSAANIQVSDYQGKENLSYIF